MKNQIKDTRHLFARIRPIYGPQHAELILAPIILRDFLAELKRNGALVMRPPKGNWKN